MRGLSVTAKNEHKRVPGVREAHSSFEIKQAVVTFDNTKSNVDALRKAAGDVDFPSTLNE